MSRPTTADKTDEIGTLIVVLLKARNLNDKHTFRKQDAYAQASLNGTVKKSKIEVKAGQHPVWDDEVRFPILRSTGDKYRKMEVACYAKEARTDDLLGKTVVDITDILRTGEFDEWVSLEIDGVARGEIYLEMTYFSNAPIPPPTQKPSAAPNKHLLAVQGQNSLQRRPSKLSPNERLSRPNANPELTSLLTSPGHHHSGKPIDKPLPSPLASPRPPQLSPGAGLPSSLTPASGKPLGRPVNERPPIQQLHGAAPLPTILRPGTGAGSPTPIPGRPQGSGHHRNPSASPPSQGLYGPTSSLPSTSSDPNPYISSTPSSSNPYISPSPPGGSPYTPPTSLQPANSGPISPYHGRDTASPHNSIPSLPPFSPPPERGRSDTPLIWQGDIAVTAPTPDTATFSFPLANPATAPSGPAPYRHPSGHSPVSYYSPTNPVPGPALYYGPSTRGDYDYEAVDRPDPHLLARYQTPLPLPPGATKPQQPAPVPTPAVPPSAPAPGLAPVSRTETNITTPQPDSARVEALRWAEEEARRRHEQEQKDLELALQLDRELNL